MSTLTDGNKQNAKKLRFTLLSAFFNFAKNSLDSEIQNPCNNPALGKLFRAGKPAQLKIFEKDVIDEIIFRTRNQRNRLMLELMARSGMRIGEVLKLKPMNIENRKAIIRDPKSGRFEEMAASGDRPAAIVKKRGLAQISDAGAIENAVDEVLANNPQQVEDYRGGKTKVLGFLVGQVMKATRGKANPKLVNQVLREKLG